MALVTALSPGGAGPEECLAIGGRTDLPSCDRPSAVGGIGSRETGDPALTRDEALHVVTADVHPSVGRMDARRTNWTRKSSLSSAPTALEGVPVRARTAGRRHDTDWMEVRL